MLTLQNYFKLCTKPVGKLGWEIGFCNEQKDYYEIKLEHKHLSSVYVRLQRNKTQMGGREVYRFTDIHGTATQQGVTLNYIKDINNLLKSLEHFIS
jgi:hypothetical protein